MNKLKTIAYAGYLACALCFGKSAEVVFSHPTPLIAKEFNRSIDLFVACSDYNAPGSLIARGYDPEYARERKKRFDRETSSLVEKINDIRSNPNYHNQLVESNNKALTCWGYQIVGLLMAGMGGFFHLKNHLTHNKLGNKNPSI